MEIQDSIELYINQGFNVIPIDSKTKIPKIR